MVKASDSRIKSSLLDSVPFVHGPRAVDRIFGHYGDEIDVCQREDD